MSLPKLQTIVLAFVLFFPGLSLYGQEEQGDAEVVARAFLRAISMGDTQAVKDHTLDMHGIEELTKKDDAWEKPSEEEIDEYMERISLRGFPRWSEDHAEAHYAFVVNWGGTQCQLPLRKVDGQWKVDARWWLAFQEESQLEHTVCRGLMYAMISSDAVAIERLAVPDENLWVLSHGPRPPGGDLGQYHHICASMPLVRLEEGDIYYDPTQQKLKTLDDAFGEDGRMLLVGQFGVSGEIPFVLVKDGDGWRVDVTFWIQTGLDHFDEEEKAAGREAYPRRLRDSRVAHAVRDPEGLKQLEGVLKEGLSQEELDRALHLTVDQYWYVKQFDNEKSGKRLLAMAAALLESGADSNARDGVGEIVLVKMILNGNGGNEAMIALLLKHGASPRAADVNGLSAVSCLAEWPNADYQRLIEAAVDEEQ